MFENLLNQVKAQAEEMVQEQFKPLFDAGYSKDDVCQWRNTAELISTLMDASKIVSHLTDVHEDLAAAKLDLAIADYLKQRIDPVIRMNELMGMPAPPASSIDKFIRETRRIHDDLEKKLQDRKDLADSLEETSGVTLQ